MAEERMFNIFTQGICDFYVCLRINGKLYRALDNCLAVKSLRVSLPLSIALMIGVKQHDNYVGEIYMEPLQVQQSELENDRAAPSGKVRRGVHSIFEIFRTFWTIRLEQDSKGFCMTHCNFMDTNRVAWSISEFRDMNEKMVGIKQRMKKKRKEMVDLDEDLSETKSSKMQIDNVK
jgi:hypothetical protein